MLREDFLQQSAFGPDAYCPPAKQYWMLKVILHHFYLLDGAVRRGCNWTGHWIRTSWPTSRGYATGPPSAPRTRPTR